MSERLLICHYCKEKFPTNELIQVSKSSRSCKSCKQNRDDYKELIDYVCKGFGQIAPTGKQVKDIKTFKEMGISYKEIQWTLYYIFCIANKRIVNNSLGLVTFYHKEAKDHFLTVERVRESSKDIVLPKEITIIRGVSDNDNNSKARLNKTRYVNIAEIY